MSTLYSAYEIPLTTVQSSSGASYAIPADRYAIVRAQVDKGGTFSIGGTVVLSSRDDTWSTISRSSGNLWSVSTGESTVAANGSASGPGQMLGVGNLTATVNPVFANATARGMTSASETFKVPEGTTIQGSGNCRYSVELYRMPGTAA